MVSDKVLQQFLRGKQLYFGAIDGDIGPLSIKAMREATDGGGWSVKRLKLGTYQLMCMAAGIPPGPIDGIMGPKTRGAMAIFEARQDGRDKDSDEDDPINRTSMPWLDRAMDLAGTREIAGKRHNPVIMGWAKSQGIWYPSDETAWCGLFVSHCFHYALPDEPQPSNPLGARQWLKFGTQCDPGLGAVLVFYRGKRSGWMGHVGFYVGEDNSAYHVLGGNQANAVNVKRIAKSRLLGARWPRTAGPAKKIIRKVNAKGRLSTNEA